MLADALTDVLAVTAFPVLAGRSSGPTTRWSGSKRRSVAVGRVPVGNMVGIFPNRSATRRLVGRTIAEQHDAWVESRSHLTLANDLDAGVLPTSHILETAA